ncbi:MAG TPA: DUF1385 domain-containing protein [Polyangiaceae bacterium]|jgi:uncharacterized protein YqhQ|nr:DUF1385 domain-containing protein [Polyangiaceae bacterium]
MEPTRPYIGGQAVLEGVMMRSPGSFAVVVRRRDGTLNIRERVMSGGRRGLAKLPLFRGVASLVESLRLGSEALKFSADLMQKDFDLPVVSSMLSLIRAIGFQLFLLATTEGNAETPPPAQAEKKGIGPMLVIMVLFLIALPQITAAGIMKLFHVDWPVTTVQFQALTGGVKLTIVLGYLLLIRRMADIRRVFQYHGAEHKTISTYEANEPLDVEHARAKTTLHPRCGTTFLVMIVIISVFLFSILGAILGAFLPPTLTGSKFLDNALLLLIKLPALPLLAAVTFEIQRVFAKYCTTGPLRALLVPGFLVQKITTIEPDDSQLEVALASLRATLLREEGHAGKGAKDVEFPTYAAMAAAASLRG